MYNYRLVETTDDFQKVSDLWKSKTTLMRQTVDSTEFDLRRGKIAGAFTSDDELVGTLRSVNWMEPTGLPFHSMGGFYLKTGLVKQLNFSSEVNPTGKLLDMLLEYQESRNIYNWYYVRPIAAAYAKIRADGNELLAHSELGKRYRRDVEEVVLPGQRSKFRMHNLLLLNKTWTRPMMVIKCCLENKYRLDGDLFEKEDIYYEQYKEF